MTTFTGKGVWRVRNTGVPEEFEISPPDQPTMVYSVRIFPLLSGFVLLADVIVDKITLPEKGARSAAYENLIDCAPGLARGMFNIRGIMTQVSTGLCTLLHSDESRMIGVRFSTLFDASNRASINDATEALLTLGKPFSLIAALLGSRAPDRMVSVSAAPMHSSDGGTGGVLLIAPRQSA
jgi:hypothetical protein